ncbi:MAG TPA: 2OG-Fe(II) oxygenase [Acidimicrobiales bacterium]|nr:2OG-Fe(II) oxygenase [Acidimicrobiales bacterium]
MTPRGAGTASEYRRRVDGADWAAVAAELAELGCALLPRLLTVADARRLIKLYTCDEAFRSTVNMRRHGFGAGEYRYLASPLPDAIVELRDALYPHLLPIARDWHAKLGRPTPWPDTLDEWLNHCHQAGQTKPTPLILKYGPGDWNALHRDLYGELVFPLQVVINLTDPGKDHTGGEFLLVEQRPRAQSRGTSATLPHLQGMVFTTRDRPIRNSRGWSAAPVRHGVSVLRSGKRYTLGLLFYDAS